jgi:primosomal protein N' (replication factor Y) (superfamily II helicase)
LSRESGGILGLSEGTVAVAVEAPQHAGLAATLDYNCERPLLPGTLVRVPLGKRHVPGIVWDRADTAAVDAAHIKPVGDVLDAMPPLPAAWRQLVAFAAAYYQRSVGELALAVLPPELRKLVAGSWRVASRA